MSQWLKPIDNLFTTSTTFSSDLAANGAGIGYLIVFLIALIVVLWLLIKLGHTGSRVFSWH